MRSKFRRIFHELKKRYYYGPMSRSSTVRRMVLQAENAVPLNGVSGVLYSVSDHDILVHPQDMTVGSLIRTTGSLHREIFDKGVDILVREGALKGRTFLDIGGNIGTHTIYAIRSGYFDRSIAIEPEPRNFALLKQNIALNGLNAIPINCAVGSSEGQARLSIHHFNHGGHSLVSEFRDGNQVTVPVRTVDAILREVGAAGVGLISMDIEGGEPAALQGMRSLHGVPVMIELTPEAPGFTEMFEVLRKHYKKAVDLRTGIANDLAGLATPDARTDMLFY